MSERLSPMMEALKQVRNTPSTVRDALAGRDKRLREEMKTKNPSTPARCDELETILWGNSVALSRPHDPEVWNRTVASCPRPFYTVELVTRRSAEEVIAAKDARIAELEGKLENVYNK